MTDYQRCGSGLNQPDRPRQVWSQYELDKGIYPFWEKDVLIQNSNKVTEL